VGASNGRPAIERNCGGLSTLKTRSEHHLGRKASFRENLGGASCADWTTYQNWLIWNLLGMLR